MQRVLSALWRAIPLLFDRRLLAAVGVPILVAIVLWILLAGTVLGPLRDALAGLLTGAHLQQRLDQAAAVGALVTTRRGDLAAMPSRTEVDELLTQPSVPA